MTKGKSSPPPSLPPPPRCCRDSCRCSSSTTAAVEGLSVESAGTTEEVGDVTGIRIFNIDGQAQTTCSDGNVKPES